MENWTDKYCPTKSLEIADNVNNITAIRHYLSQFNKTTVMKPNIMITGKNGIGKTLIVNILLKEEGYQKIEANLQKLASLNKGNYLDDNNVVVKNKNLMAYYKSLHSNKIIVGLGAIKSRKIALVFDDVGNVSNSKEKEIIKYIVKLNNKLKYFPIIIISNNRHSKIITDLRKIISYTSPSKKTQSKSKNSKFINEIFLTTPSYENLIKLINTISQKEQVNMSKNVLNDIVEHSQNDIRRLINIIQELKIMFKNELITNEMFLKYCETSRIKDMNMGIYITTANILGTYTSVNEILTMYSEDRTTIPLMVHENYPRNISIQYPQLSQSEKINQMFKISESISFSDKIDGIVYSNQSWNLQPVHGFYSCVIPSYYTNNLPNKNNKCVKYEFTRDYNGMSITKINNKVIKNARRNSLLRNVSIYDFLYVSHILKSLINQQNKKLLREISECYNFSLDDIITILKINKIDKDKNIVQTKLKTEIKKLLEK
jgi:DNA polymerase III delta prime subunit